MDASLVTLCVGLATVLTSGVVSSIVTYRLNRNKEHTFFMRQKAEALYLAAHEYGIELSSHLLPYLSVAQGKIDYNQMLDMQIASHAQEKKRGGAETMLMLTRIYFPEVLPELNALLGLRDRLNEIASDHKAAYREVRGTGPTWVKAFQSVGLELHVAIEALQAAIVKAAQHYAGSAKPHRFVALAPFKR